MRPRASSHHAWRLHLRLRHQECQRSWLPRHLHPSRRALAPRTQLALMLVLLTSAPLGCAGNPPAAARRKGELFSWIPHDEADVVHGISLMQRNAAYHDNTADDNGQGSGGTGSGDHPGGSTAGTGTLDDGSYTTEDTLSMDTRPSSYAAASHISTDLPDSVTANGAEIGRAHV